MRKNRIFLLGSFVVMVWITGTYFLFVHRPKSNQFNLPNSLFNFNDERYATSLKSLHNHLEDLDERLKSQVNATQLLAKSVRDIEELRRNGKSHEKKRKIDADEVEKNFSRLQIKPYTNEVIAVLMFACNRVTVSKALDSLLANRKNQTKFPIIVSQDCGHAATAEVIRGYSNNITFIQQPDLSEIEVPVKEKKFRGYFKIARHYGWALDQVFKVMKYNQVIIVEDDLEFAPDFYDYFAATLPILRSDPTLWCVSAWNDNGKRGLIDTQRPELLYRTDFFGGLGWMLTKELWVNELGPKWPKSYWDDWMRQPAQRRGRACIRPEVSRTKTFGKIGVSNGLFFDKHLKFIELNSQPVDFTRLNLAYLMKGEYDRALDETLARKSPIVTLSDLTRGQVGSHKFVRVLYHTKDAFKRIAKALGIMDDFKSGVPRMAYRGIVATVFRNQRVFVAPNLNWKGYDPSW